jgi:RimJ/RimL family protein N-acetyltransferase
LKFQPTLKTSRLRLRPFVATDAEVLSDLAGSREVADSTVGFPHPYSLVAARAWIAGLPHFYKADGAVNFAVELQSSGELIGGIALRNIDSANRCAELCFWIGVPWWGNGYATEATWELLHFGLSEFGLNRVEARHLVRNAAPQNVLGKLGMSSEGVLRQGIRIWDTFEDVMVHSLLRADVEAAGAASE